MHHLFSLIKHGFYIFLVVLVIFLFWFLPKYSYVKENPGYCVNLTNNLYWCGDENNLQELFQDNKQIDTEKLKQLQDNSNNLDAQSLITN